MQHSRGGLVISSIHAKVLLWGIGRMQSPGALLENGAQVPGSDGRHRHKHTQEPRRRGTDGGTPCLAGQ